MSWISAASAAFAATGDTGVLVLLVTPMFVLCKVSQLSRMDDYKRTNIKILTCALLKGCLKPLTSTLDESKNILCKKHQKNLLYLQKFSIFVPKERLKSLHKLLKLVASLSLGS